MAEPDKKHSYENIPVATFIINADGIISYSNHLVIRLFGRSSEEIEGSHIKTLVAQADKYLMPELKRIPPGSQRHIINKSGIRRSGQTFPLEIYAGHTPSENDKSSSYILTMHDISGFISENQEQCRQINRRTGKMVAAGIATEYETLIGELLYHMKSALESLPLRAKGRDDVAAAGDAAALLADLTKKMLTLSTSQLQTQTTVNINSAAGKVIEELSLQLPPRVSIEKHLTPEPPLIHGDIALLQTLIDQIALNAIEASPPNGNRITISTNSIYLDEQTIRREPACHHLAPGNFAEISVRDSGYGMDKVILSRLFTPFFSTKKAGRGLGLIEARGIVMAHNGAVIIHSSPGKGTNTRVLLPVISTGAENKIDKQDISRKYTATILVADDEPGIRRYAQRILNYHNYRVYTAEDGEDAIDVFRSHADQIDLVLLDMFMPQMTGNEVLKNIRKLRSNVKVLIISAYSESALSEKFDNPPDGFLYKPFATSDFLEAVSHILEQKTRRKK